MSVLSRLASSLGRKDEAPNQELAEKIIRSRDRKAVKVLVDNLTNKDSKIKSDCIKVLYEVSGREPELIANYVQDFAKLLGSKNNRLVWGAMTALDTITVVSPHNVYKLLPAVMAAAESGSVIARDHTVGILIGLARNQEYASACLPLLMRQLRTCPDNQFPMYAEMSMPVISQENKNGFLKILRNRQNRFMKESQKKRIDKLVRKLTS
jgi:hypothetical protein